MERIYDVVVSLFFWGLIYIYLRRMAEKDELFKIFVRNSYIIHPNAICIWRTLTGFFSIWLIYCSEYTWGIFFYLGSAIFDSVDGIFARECGLITKFGKWLDPICDKLTYLPMLIFFGNFFSIKLIILVALEIISQFSRIILKYFNISTSANIYGKIKTTLLHILVVYILLLNQNIEIPNYKNTLLNICIFFSALSNLGRIIPIFKKIFNTAYINYFFKELKFNETLRLK